MYCYENVQFIYIIDGTVVNDCQYVKITLIRRN